MEGVGQRPSNKVTWPKNLTALPTELLNHLTQSVGSAT